jgi:O-antigen/teichoic acid export membrane protein
VKPFDERGAFRPGSEDGALRILAVRAAGITALSQGLRLATQMIATIVLARLLTPADFGRLAMVTTFSLLLMNFGLNGFTEAIVQRDTIDHALASNLFWINTAVSFALAIGFAAGGSLLARFYADPRLTPVVAAMALTIVFTALSVVHVALLKRAMRFGAASFNDIVAQAGAVVVSIVLAWRGWGYWALVAGAVALPLVTLVGAWILCRWVPGRPRRREGTAASARFALTTYAHFAMNYCTRNLDNLLVGWFFGPQSLGFYKKAYDLFFLPVSQLSTPLYAVAVPTLSRLTGDPDRYRRYVLRILSTLAFVGMGLGAMMTLVGNDLMLLVLGPAWRPSGTIFTVFGPGIGVLLIYVTHGWIHLSLGRADRWFAWGVAEFIATAMLFGLGLRWGPIGVAGAWVVSFWALTIPAVCYAGIPTHLRVAAVVGAVWKYTLASAIAGFASAAFIWRVPLVAVGSTPIETVTRIGEISTLFGTLYLVAVILLHGGTAPLSQIAGLVRDVSGRGHRGRSATALRAAFSATEEHALVP